MAVVIKPTENRLAMAKPPPKKLDEREANKINEGRKQGWNNGNGLFSIAAVKKLGRRWRINTITNGQK